MEPEGLLLCSEVLASDHYTEPTSSDRISLISTLKLSFHQILGLPSGSSVYVILSKFCTYF
jgi:hypothetical protein